MKSVLLYFGKQFAFWFVLFGITRAVFLAYNIAELAAPPLTETLAAFFHALALDLSAVCYISVFPLLLFSVQAVLPSAILNGINRIYVLLIILLISLITAAELGLYDEWGTKLSHKALLYLEHPSEVFNTAGPAMSLGLGAVVLLQFALGAWIYNRFVFISRFRPRRSVAGGLLLLAAGTPLLFVGLRGGVQPIPINQSASYYSGHNILNQASVNSAWNLAHSVADNIGHMDRNPFRYFSDEEAQDIVRDLYDFPRDSVSSALTVDRPNVVLIILESWSADLVAALGGDTGVTPVFDSLVRDGVLFTETYSSGTRSHEGMGALLSGFPAQSAVTIVSQPDKFVKLPCISRNLKSAGYSTSFYFGGQLIYGNIKGFIHSNQFDRILEGDDFGSDIPRGRLGVHDGHLFARHLADMKREAEPFFSVLFTLSTHAPFDMPLERHPVTWGGEERRYLNSAWYTDRELGRYLAKARTQPWYDNTLFVIVADHSHRSHRMRHFYSPGYHKIPMLLYGEVIKPEQRGRRIGTVASQVDVPATLLARLRLPHDEYEWSRDLFNPSCPGFAFFAYTEGYGWVRPCGHVSYHHTTGDWLEAEGQADTLEVLRREGRAYMQTVFRRYLEF